MLLLFIGGDTTKKSSVKIKGFKDVQKDLRNITEVANQKKKKVSFDKVFTDSFMINNTSFSSIHDFIDTPIFANIENLDDIPEGLDAYVNENTKFPTWKIMLESASVEYIAKELGI